jgi:hypothetical protein
VFHVIGRRSPYQQIDSEDLDIITVENVFGESVLPKQLIIIDQSAENESRCREWNDGAWVGFRSAVR